ncbi:hypothetical protein ACW95P_04250, partial [Candidatus Mycoplasma pogonae]
MNNKKENNKNKKNKKALAAWLLTGGALGLFTVSTGLLFIQPWKMNDSKNDVEINDDIFFVNEPTLIEASHKSIIKDLTNLSETTKINITTDLDDIAKYDNKAALDAATAKFK